MKANNQSQGQTQSVPTKKPFYKKWWVITIAVIVFLMMIGSCSSDKSTTQNTKDQPQKTDTQNVTTTPEEKPATPEPLTPQVTITSADISTEYAENEVAADAKYKGKIVEIAGKIVGIDNGSFDNSMIVKLSDGQYDINTPWCYMKESEKSKVLEFKKGQQVTLIGKGDSATMGSPIFKDCVVK